MQQAIAILDSGVGGLTVVKEVMRQLPQEKIIYFGDTARTPYGPRTSDEVVQFTKQIVDFLVEYQPKMIVIACNTATAVALEYIRESLDIPVVGVIHPGARAAIKKSKTKTIGIIGTEGTVRSKAYEYALHTISPSIKVISQACPKLVPLVEKGWFDTEQTRDIVNQSLRSLKETLTQKDPMDCLIMGCTHYPFLRKAIADTMGSDVHLVNSAEETAREISTILHDRVQLANKNNPKHMFFSSGDTRVFQHIASRWLGEPVNVLSVTWRHPVCYEVK